MKQPRVITGAVVSYLKVVSPLMKEEKGDQFEENKEDVDHHYAEGDQAKGIAKASFGILPDQTKERIAVRIAQEHEVLVIAGIDQVDDACQ